MTEYVLFGDSEPEDGWDPDDSVAEQVDNLVRRAELLSRRRVRLAGDGAAATLDALSDIVRRARRKRLYGRDLVRADQLDEDIAFVRGRL